MCSCLCWLCNTKRTKSKWRTTTTNDKRNAKGVQLPFYESTRRLPKNLSSSYMPYINDKLRYQLPFRTVCAQIALVFVVFVKHPIKYKLFWQLNNSRKWLFIQKEAKFFLFGKWEGLFTRTCLHRLGSTPSRNKQQQQQKNKVKWWTPHSHHDTSG